MHQMGEDLDVLQDPTLRHRSTLNVVQITGSTGKKTSINLSHECAVELSKAQACRRRFVRVSPAERHRRRSDWCACETDV